MKKSKKTKSNFTALPMHVILWLSLVILSISNTSMAQRSSSGLWQDVTESSLRIAASERRIVPLQYRTVSLNQTELHSLLNTAPVEFTAEARTRPVTFPVPMPDGTTQHFAIVNSPVMEAGLAAKYPEIKTFAGQGIDDPSASVYIDWTYQGFHLMILSDKGSVFIDPYSISDRENYIVYYKKDYVPSAEKLQYGVCYNEYTDNLPEEGNKLMPQLFASSGTELRTYRLAVAAAGEYTAFHGGTVALALSAITTTMNRVNGIYRTEVAIRMVLIANNDVIIYTDAASDPYTNGSPGAMIDENQSNITSEIGSANFDIGHVFGTNSGGLAGQGPCDDGTKARGITGSGSPVGDPFDVDYVAHEMGHQFSARHTFNGSTGSCSGSPYASSSAYEPGSGTTIMAYAGICSGQNIQPNSDAYFHSRSFDQIVAYSTTGTGNGCAVTTTTGNNPPAVVAGAGGFTIPKSTPFTLTGFASDPDGQPVTYCWEQYDLGPQGAPNSPSGNAPIFRSFTPVTSPSRTFPKLADILSNTQVQGEILPSYGRDLSFRLTARDNQFGGGGVDYSSLSFSVSNIAGPFAITSQNSSVTWCSGNTETVTWDVAGTNLSPISTAEVNIKLSLDGGLTFPTTLAANTPNDGSHDIIVPNGINTTTARIKIEAVGNIYFDISNANFAIYESPVVTLQPVSQAKQWGDNVTFTAAASGNPTPTIQWERSTNGGVSFSPLAGETSGSLTITCLTLDENGYKYRARFTNTCDVIYSDIATLTVTPRVTSTTLVISPNPQQYSDLVSFTATISNAAACGQQAATGVSFYIGTQLMGTASFSVSGSDLVATLSDVELLEPSPFGTSPTGQMAPGARTATAIVDGANSNFIVNDGSTIMNIEPEDARAYYTGACFASTLGANNCNAIVTLSATIKDISAVAGDPDYDSYPGDIRNATVTFINRETNTVIAANVPIGLVDPMDATIAVATYNWNVCITGNAQTFEVGIIVGGYYSRNSSEDNVLINVAKPLGNFVTGGGYIVLANSAGIVTGDAGSKSNFGFNTKFNKRGTNLQGNVNIIVRKTIAGVVRTYRIKSNVFTSLGVQAESWGGKATVNSKAIAQDITDPNNPISIFGNGSMQIKFTDRGEPGTNDSIAITIWNKNGGLWYSSNWNSTNTAEQMLGAGNLKINSSNSFGLREDLMVGSSGETDEIVVFPNPGSGLFNIAFKSESDNMATLTVFDLFGKKITEGNVETVAGKNTFELDLSNYSSGIYLLHISTAKSTKVQKIVIEK